MMKRTLLAAVMLLPLAMFLVPSSLAFAASRQVHVHPFNNFSATCSGFSISQRGVLKATCTRANGSENFGASLGLDQFIGNNDGTLVANGIHFTESCNTLQLSGAQPVILTADCRTLGGNFPGTSCNLDNSIDNSNGALVWQRGNNC